MKRKHSHHHRSRHTIAFQQINALSDELLSLIFQTTHCLLMFPTKQTDFSIIISHTSHRFRAIALQNARLWATIHDKQTYTEFVTFLARSKSHRLNLTIGSNRDQTNDFAQTIIDISPRIFSLNITKNHPRHPILHPVHLIRTGSSPSPHPHCNPILWNTLQISTIHRIDYNPNQCPFELSAPQLQILHLKNADARLIASNIHTLVYEITRSDTHGSWKANTFLSLIAQLPRLRKMRLVLSERECLSLDTYPPITCSASYIQLVLKTRRVLAIQNLSQAMIVPNLRHLHCRFLDTPSTMFTTSFSRAICPHIRHVNIEFERNGRRNWAYDTSHILKTFSHSPILTLRYATFNTDVVLACTQLLFRTQSIHIIQCNFEDDMLYKLLQHITCTLWKDHVLQVTIVEDSNNSRPGITNACIQEIKADQRIVLKLLTKDHWDEVRSGSILSPFHSRH